MIIPSISAHFAERCLAGSNVARNQRELRLGTPDSNACWKYFYGEISFAEMTEGDRHQNLQH